MPAQVESRALLTAKMTVPPVRAGALTRQRLHDRLDRSGSRCTVVVAPAGWGKSTLLSTWARDPARRGTVAWVSLDESDDDPVRFWTYALTALSRVAADLTAEPLAILAAEGADPVEVALSSLLNGLAETDTEHVLVLDDYHVCRDEGVHGSVEFLVTYLPTSLRLVIASRTEPPVSLPRMRARGELLEIRRRDLACTADEGVALVVGVEEAARPAAGGLVERTEGWPAGLHLCALTVRDAADPVAAAGAIRGDHRHLLDYFGTEVLPGLDVEARDLLIGCSVLDRLSGSLCDAVLETTGSGAVLDRLERAEVFVTALDPAGQWFRCHQLFRDVLRRELDLAAPASSAALLVRAARWYEAEGRVEDAVAHRIAAGDERGALELLGSHSAWFLDHGATASLLRFGEQLADRCATDAWACLWLAYAAGVSRRPRVSRRWLDAAEPLIEGESRPMAGWSNARAASDAIRSRYAVPGDNAAALFYGRRAVEQENDATGWGWVAARLSLAEALDGDGSVVEQVAVLEEAWRAPTRALPIRLRLQTAGELANGLILLGEHGRARLICDEMAETATATEQDAGAGAATATCELRLAQARLAVIDDGPRAALPRLRAVVRLAQGYGRGATIVAALTELAAAQRAVGDHTACRAALDHAHEVADGDPPDPRTAAALDDVEGRTGRWQVARARDGGELVEEITDRELVVLRALRSSMTAREIGDDLFLSINTIKSHTRSVYRKLGVDARADAVAAGRRLGLI